MDRDAAGDALEQHFHAAADHLGQLVSANPTGVHDAVKLQLYGLYKQATVGPCTAPKPAFWDRAARLKWYAYVTAYACSRNAHGISLLYAKS